MTDLATMIVDLVQSGQVKEEDATIAFSLAKFYQRHGTITKPMELTAYSVLSGYDAYNLSGIDRPVDDDSDTVEVLDPKTPGAGAPLALKRKSSVRFDVEGNWIIGTTPFDLKDLCKSIPGRKWSPPEHPKKWCWPRGPVAAMALRDAFAAYEPDWDPLFDALLDELDDAKAHKISTDHPDIDSVTTVAWMHQRQAYQFIKSLRGAALWMDMGCLAGDAEIQVNRGGNGIKVKIADLVTKFNGGKVDGGNGPRGWDLRIPTMVRGLRADGTTGLVRLVAALETGVKPVVTVTLESGRQLRCTPDHEILTPERWKVHASDLAPGDHVLADELGGRGWEKTAHRQRHGWSPVRVTPPSALTGSQDGGGYVWVYEPDHPMATPQGQVLEHRKVMADHLGRVLLSSEHVHHLDENVTNNDLSNLELVSTKEHALHHRWSRNLAGSLPVLDTVASVVEGPPEPVYDLSVADDAHTYTANGIVVGNTGKSLPAVARALDIGGHILIVCPDKVVGVWPREFRRHGARPVHIENGLRAKKRGYGHKKLTVKERVAAFDELRECTCGKPHVYVTNYDTIVHQPLQSWLVNRKWDLFIMDESQKIKAPQGIQSKIAAKIGAKSDWRLQLTGTPLPQSPLDVFAQYRALDAGIFGNAFTTFRNRYALMGGYEDREFIDMNPATVDELNTKMFQFAFRVESDDVLDLPKIMEDQFLSCSMEGAQAKAYKDMDDEMTAEFPGTTVAEMVERVLTGETIAPNAMVKLLRLRQITGGALRDDESGKALMVGDAKGKLLAEWMEDFPKNEPLVVFAEFTHDLAVIRAVAEKQGRSHGEVSGSRNDLTIDSEFPEHLDVLAVQIASGGSGVDLTRACYGAYYSTGYSNGNYRQSRARLHRPGQTRSVRFTHLLCEDTVDQVVFQTLEGKQELVDRVMGGGR